MRPLLDHHRAGGDAPAEPAIWKAAGLSGQRYDIGADPAGAGIVRLWEGRRQFALVRWGLVPSWVKDPRKLSLMHVARGESVNDKPAFKNAMKRRRCLVPADGFYEWTETGKRKRPFFVRAKSAGPIAFAGLWERKRRGPNWARRLKASRYHRTTPSANRTPGAVYERACRRDPAAGRILDMWPGLLAKVDPETAAALIVAAPEDLLEAYEVSNAVNRTANDGPSLIMPVAEQAETAAPAPPPAPAVKRSRKAKPDKRQPSLF